MSVLGREQCATLRCDAGLGAPNSWGLCLGYLRGGVGDGYGGAEEAVAADVELEEGGDQEQPAEHAQGAVAAE